MADRMLQASEVAQKLNLSTRTVQDMIRRKELPSCQVTKSRRMVPEGALDKWIASNTVWPDQSSTESHLRNGTSSGERTDESAVYLHANPIDTLPSEF